MSNLTKEQLDVAKKYIENWCGVQVEENGLNELAKHLQFPLEPVTDAEMDVFVRRWQTESLLARKAIDLLIQSRNASRIPKPVDPREDIIFHAIHDHCGWHSATHENELIGRILSALDGMSKA